MKNELPCVFDLLYDIKTMDDVEHSAAGTDGGVHGASAEKLRDLFIREKLPLPECLLGHPYKEVVYLSNNGTWTAHEPLSHEMDGVILATIQVYKEGF